MMPRIAPPSTISANLRPSVAVAAFWFTGESGRRLSRNWTRWDWVGFSVLLICAASVVDLVAAHKSGVWHLAPQDYKIRTVKYCLRAGGALTIGLGVLPTVAGLAALVRPRNDPPTRERRAR